jgi:Tol biopolymer transport system component
LSAFSTDRRKHIAFARTKTGTSPLRLYLIDPNGRHVRRLTNTFADNPSWSPDGSRLAFDDGHSVGIVDLATGLVHYVTAGTDDADPAWSPEGHQIAFERDGGVWVMHADGSAQRRVAARGSDPAWERGS